MPLLSGSHNCNGRRRGCDLDVYSQVSFKKGVCVDILDLHSGCATSAGGQTLSGENGWLCGSGARLDFGVVGVL